MLNRIQEPCKVYVRNIANLKTFLKLKRTIRQALKVISPMQGGPVARISALRTQTDIRQPEKRLKLLRRWHSSSNRRICDVPLVWLFDNICSELRSGPAAPGDPGTSKGLYTLRMPTSPSSLMNLMTSRFLIAMASCMPDGGKRKT